MIVYTEPNAAKVRHVRAHPRVSFNLDSDGNGAGIIIVGGAASVDAEDADPLTDERYVANTASTPPPLASVKSSSPHTTPG